MITYTLKVITDALHPVPAAEFARTRAEMQRARYGETVENGMGWEIDHIIPVSRNGTGSRCNGRTTG